MDPVRYFARDPQDHTTDPQEEIARRADALWEQAGKPEGKDEEFYHQAERELQSDAHA